MSLDGPERDDQLAMSGRNQLSMSPDEQGYIRPHNLAIPQKVNGKNYYIYSKSQETHPQGGGQWSRSLEGKNQLSMSPDEQAHIRPHNLAVHQKFIGKKYYIPSKSHESHPEKSDQLSINWDDYYYYYYMIIITIITIMIRRS